MSSELKDKVGIITGAARGIGAAIAEEFHCRGAQLGILDLDGGPERLARDLEGGDRILPLQADVTDEEQVKASVNRVAQRFGHIDILVNCAGTLKHMTIEAMSVPEFELVVKANLTGTFIVCKAVVPFMKRQGKGKIINISSLGGRTGRPGVGVNYAASKAGVVGLTQCLAQELGPVGIYVNAIAPGPIHTDLTRKVPRVVFARWNIGRALERDGLPQDVAQTAVFLASDESDWITGVTLDVNGGIFIH